MKTWQEYLTQHGFDPLDAPYPPLKPSWTQYPIVKCIHDWERETGQTYTHGLPA